MNNLTKLLSLHFFGAEFFGALTYPPALQSCWLGSPLAPWRVCSDIAWTQSPCFAPCPSSARNFVNSIL
eukprot:g19696.t1